MMMFDDDATLQFVPKMHENSQNQRINCQTCRKDLFVRILLSTRTDRSMTIYLIACFAASIETQVFGNYV